VQISQVVYAVLQVRARRAPRSLATHRRDHRGRRGGAGSAAILINPWNQLPYDFVEPNDELGFNTVGVRCLTTAIESQRPTWRTSSAERQP